MGADLLKPIDLIKVKKITLNNIPCLLIRPENIKGDLPTLFHYHGWSSKKGNHIFFAKIIAQFGFQVILPDSKFHGERNPLSDFGLENLREYFWEIATQSVDEFQNMKEQAIKFYNVDRESIAVSGNSMGGYISSSIFARDNEIKCLVCFIGGCAWIKSEEIIREKLGLELSKKIDFKRAKIYDPLTYKENFYPRPILMLHGRDDDVVPLEIQRYFYKVVAPYYTRDIKRLRLEIHQDIRHQVGFRMVESAANFLDRYLHK